MEKLTIKSLPKDEQQRFYQSKYEYYRSFNMCMIIVSCLAYLSFFFTDCGIFGRIAYETILSRVIVIFPFIGYCFLAKTVKNYRIMVPATYLMIHIIIWCTEWATYLLPDRQHAISGMIIMNLIFMCAGFAAPFRYSVIGHAIMIVDIFVADLFIHFENLEMMYMFNVPCVIAVCVMHRMMQKVYLENYMTKDKLRKLATRDQLTDVYNRNILREISDPITGWFNFSSDLDVSMLLVDLDFFKKVNDVYGHEAGDRVLAHLADILKASVRATDYVIRWGGEEFVIIMPGCTADQAVRVAEKIREKVEHTDNGVCPLTISIGVSIYKEGDYHDSLKEADHALYQAKANGRNQVVLYEAKK